MMTPPPPPPPEITLVCIPVAANYTPIKGSQIVVCMQCMEPVWFSPSSQALRGNIHVLCGDCAGIQVMLQTLAGDPPQFGGILPNQSEELKAALDETNEETKDNDSSQPNPHPH